MQKPKIWPPATCDGGNASMRAEEKALPRLASCGKVSPLILTLKIFEILSSPVILIKTDLFNFAIIFNTAVTGKWTADFIFSSFQSVFSPYVTTHPLPLRIIYSPILRAWDSSRITRTKGIAMGEEGKVFLSPLRQTESFPFASEVNGKFSVRLLEGQLSHCSMSY